MSVFLPSDFGPPFGTDFIPNLMYISAITQASQGVVTFTTNHNFKVGEWISFRVPPPNGMTQLNNKKALVADITSDTVTIALDTRQFFPFIYVANGAIPAVAVPAGSGIPPGTATVTLEDAFDNQPVI